MKSLLILLTLTAAAQPAVPTCPALQAELADRRYFVVCHSVEKKVPLWVAYELTPDKLTPTVTRRGFRFRQDLDLAHPGATDQDYRHSGLTRGHVAPAEDFAWSEDALRATFILSNAVPQYHAVNSGIWARLEARVRELAAHADTTWIYTGPIFDEELEPIGANRVAVPTHLFKVVITITGSLSETFAAIVPNVPKVLEPLDRLWTTLEEVESRTGLDFPRV